VYKINNFTICGLRLVTSSESTASLEDDEDDWTVDNGKDDDHDGDGDGDDDDDDVNDDSEEEEKALSLVLGRDRNIDSFSCKYFSRS